MASTVIEIHGHPVEHPGTEHRRRGLVRRHQRLRRCLTTTASDTGADTSLLQSLVEGNGTFIEVSNPSQVPTALNRSFTGSSVLKWFSDDTEIQATNPKGPAKCSVQYRVSRSRRGALLAAGRADGCGDRHRSPSPSISATSASCRRGEAAADAAAMAGAMSLTGSRSNTIANADLAALNVANAQSVTLNNSNVVLGELEHHRGHLRRFPEAEPPTPTPCK